MDLRVISSLKGRFSLFEYPIVFDFLNTYESETLISLCDNNNDIFNQIDVL